MHETRQVGIGRRQHIIPQRHRERVAGAHLGSRRVHRHTAQARQVAKAHLDMLKSLGRLVADDLQRRQANGAIDCIGGAGRDGKTLDRRRVVQARQRPDDATGSSFWHAQAIHVAHGIVGQPKGRRLEIRPRHLVLLGDHGAGAVDEMHEAVEILHDRLVGLPVKLDRHLVARRQTRQSCALPKPRTVDGVVHPNEPYFVAKTSIEGHVRLDRNARSTARGQATDGHRLRRLAASLAHLESQRNPIAACIERFGQGDLLCVVDDRPHRPIRRILRIEEGAPHIFLYDIAPFVEHLPTKAQIGRRRRADVPIWIEQDGAGANLLLPVAEHAQPKRIDGRFRHLHGFQRRLLQPCDQCSRQDHGRHNRHPAEAPIDKADGGKRGQRDQADNRAQACRRRVAPELVDDIGTGRQIDRKQPQRRARIGVQRLASRGDDLPTRKVKVLKAQGRSGRRTDEHSQLQRVCLQVGEVE